MPSAAVAVHPRLVANTASLPPDTPLAEAVGRLVDVGLTRVGLFNRAIGAVGGERAVEILAAAGAEPVYLIHAAMFKLTDPDRWERDLERFKTSIDIAHALDIKRIYGTTGGGGALVWEQAAQRFVEASAPALAYARERGINLMLESTNGQFADIDILHTVTDTIDLCRRSGFGVALDIHPGWVDSHLVAAIDRSLEQIDLVQVSDYVPGTRSLSRSVPGDGIIPIERIMRQLTVGGFNGPVDLELWGPSPTGEDDYEALRRAAAYMTELLNRIEL